MIKCHHQGESNCEGVRTDQQPEEKLEEVCLGDHGATCCGENHDAEQKDSRVNTELILKNQDGEYNLDYLKKVIEK